jgi:hypothetical protein
MRIKNNRILLAALFFGIAQMAASAQTATPEPDNVTDNRIIVRSDAGILPVLPLMFDPVTTAELFNEKVVKNSSFSAEFQSETVRLLPGNISQNNTSQLVSRVTTLLYRDKDGRVRREKKVEITGTPTTNPAIEIYDSVLGYGYTLYPATRTAYRYKKPADQLRAAAVWDKVPQTIEITSSDRGSDNQTTQYKLDPPSIEALGSRAIHGAQAIGKRFTVKIPMNAVGNPLETETVHEVWYAPQLKMLIQSSTKNPHQGEHTFQMTSLSQTEPSASLFRVPSDYKIIEMGALITDTPPPNQE